MATERIVELLAPARNMECGIAAVNAGADAVYIGGPVFGAREAASNSVGDIASLVRYAHIFNAKVYVTLNTILFDHETEKARQLAYLLYEAGVDALIIQDMAFMMMDLPPIPLHASTQTHNYDTEKIRFLAGSGMSRIVLARELSLSQIDEIRKSVTAELEYFVHGSLCVSLSGQCYLSYAAGGRSANRGACAQPCRHKYTLTGKDGNTLIAGKHLLSLRDLNLSEYLYELADAGIDSLKIEGRLKDIDYVKNITSYYRKKLDAVLEGDDRFKRASAGRVTHGFDPDPAKSFSRGSTDYFLHGRNVDIASPDTPKSLGEELGTVTNVSGSWFEVSSDKLISNNDGLVFVDRHGETRGLKVNNVSDRRIFPDSLNGVFPGARVFRNYDHRFTMLLENVPLPRKLGVSVSLYTDGTTLTADVISETGVTASASVPVSAVIANNRETSLKAIIAQMSKTGNTPFETTAVNTGGTEEYFFPAATLNNLRRLVMDSLREKLEGSRTAHLLPEKKIIPYPKTDLGFEANISNALARRFYEDRGATVHSAALEASITTAGIKVMTTKYCLRYQAGQCPSHGGKAVDGATPAFLTDDRVNLRLEFDCKNCFMNVFLDEK